MSDNNVEQAEKTASKIGKFNTAEDLLAAYNALESEFTKRCQLIKQLQTELDCFRAQAEQEQTDQTAVGEREQPPEDIRSVPETEKGEQEIATVSAVTPDDVLNEILQNACNYAELLSTIPEVMSACIASYKQRLIRPQPASAPSGCAVIVPSKRPTTLSEAKRLADALLSGN